MNVLYSCLSKSWGGMEMITLTGIKELLKRGIHVELLCAAESRIHIEANNLGILIHPVNAGSYFHPVSSIRVSLIIRKMNFDIIHTHASKDLWLLVPSLQLLSRRIPLILTKHIGSFIVKKDFLHKRLYGYVTRTIAISSIIKKNLLDTTPLREDQIVLIPNGIDTEKFNPDKTAGEKIRNEFNISSDEILIGMMARFSPGKGHEEFIKSAAELNKKYKSLKFIIVGEASRGEDSYAEEIKLLAKKLNLDNLIFAGYRTDIPETLASMDIFVFPSHAEAFGLALTEAMAMEKPTICSASDGVLDIAVDGVTSYLYEKRNKDDLVIKLSKIINDPEVRNSFGKEGRKRILEEFNLEKVTEQVLKLYEDLT
jgi:glycosyltransferase involved in cell wall biosynthesis